MCEETKVYYSCGHSGGTRQRWCTPIRNRKGFCLGISVDRTTIPQKCASCKRAEEWAKSQQKNQQQQR